MNGIKYIREKSNFSRNSLAERMGVTRQTITLWEKDVRKPGKSHLKWLSEFYGIEEKWFADLSDEELIILKEMKMYRHYDDDKEYFTFAPDKDGWAEISVKCGSLDEMLDDRYADTLKRKKEFFQHIEGYLQYKSEKQACLFDKILVAERGMRDIECFISLMYTVQDVGSQYRCLKVPFRYEIKAVLYSLMVASGQYSVDEIKEKYPIEFEDDVLHIDEKYMNDLIGLMSAHWTEKMNDEIERYTSHRENLRR